MPSKFNFESTRMDLITAYETDAGEKQAVAKTKESDLKLLWI